LGGADWRGTGAHTKRWFEAEEKRQAQLEAEQRKAEERSIEERLEDTKQRIAAADRIIARERRRLEREEAEEREEALRHPTPAEQGNARRARVAQELGIHPSRISQEHADELFGRLGTAFMVGYEQAGQGRGAR
jgi:hypothetical protein